MFSTALLRVALPPPRGHKHNRADWGDFGDALVSVAPEVGIVFSPKPWRGLFRIFS